MKSKRVTIKDVALAAGVGVTTVSDSMSGKGRLPQETRDRIKSIADGLGYRPSAAARSLKAGRTGLLLMSVAAPNTTVESLWSIDFFVHVMTSAAIEASTRGYALALAPMNVPTSLSFDGAVVVDPTEGDDLITQALNFGVPIVTVGRSSQHTSSWVDNDYDVMVPTVLDHFVSEGAALPGLLVSDSNASYVRDTVAQYQTWCARSDIRPQVVEVSGGLTEQSGREAAAKLLSLPDRPDAIFATLDHLALGALDAASDLGLSVPGDLLVASLGDSNMIANTAVPITALNLSPSALGSRAVEILIDQIETGALPSTHVLPGELKVRLSTQRALAES